MLCTKGVVRAVEDVPITLLGPEDRNIGPAVTVKIDERSVVGGRCRFAKDRELDAPYR